MGAGCAWEHVKSHTGAAVVGAIGAGAGGGVSVHGGPSWAPGPVGPSSALAFLWRSVFPLPLTGKWVQAPAGYLAVPKLVTLLHPMAGLAASRMGYATVDRGTWVDSRFGRDTGTSRDSHPPSVLMQLPGGPHASCGIWYKQETSVKNLQGCGCWLCWPLKAAPLPLPGSVTRNLEVGAPVAPAAGAGASTLGPRSGS